MKATVQALQEGRWQTYKLESAAFDFQSLLQSLTLRVYPEAFYIGQMQVDEQGQEFREGSGVMVYKKGRVYEGGWVGDQREGRGYERYSNGNRYEGEYKKNKAEGKGVYRWANGEEYDGEWVYGLKQGYGVWRGIHDDSYIGEWRQSKAEGYGV